MLIIANTFLAKEFEDKPAIGLRIDALKGNGLFEFKLRSRPEIIYSKDKDFLRVFQSHTWKNKWGITVKIFPLEIFKVKQDLQGKLL